MQRPILSLPKAAADTIRLKASVWICRPCGARFTPPADSSDEAHVRCPACQAKLGRLGAFKAGAASSQLRARLAAR